jgi:hypothetical protein
MQIIKTEVARNFEADIVEVYLGVRASLPSIRNSLESESGREQLGAEFVKQLASALDKIKVKNEF